AHLALELLELRPGRCRAILRARRRRRAQQTRPSQACSDKVTPARHWSVLSQFMKTIEDVNTSLGIWGIPPYSPLCRYSTFSTTSPANTTRPPAVARHDLGR